MVPWQVTRLAEIRAKVVCWDKRNRSSVAPQPPGSRLPASRDATRRALGWPPLQHLEVHVLVPMTQPLFDANDVGDRSASVKKTAAPSNYDIFHKKYCDGPS